MIWNPLQIKEFSPIDMTRQLPKTCMSGSTASSASSSPCRRRDASDSVRLTLWMSFFTFSLSHKNLYGCHLWWNAASSCDQTNNKTNLTTNNSRLTGSSSTGLQFKPGKNVGKKLFCNKKLICLLKPQAGNIMPEFVPKAQSPLITLFM